MISLDMCPDPGVLAAYVEGQLSEAEVAATLGHIDHCAACRRELSALASAQTYGGGTTEEDELWWDVEATRANKIPFLAPGSLCGEYRIEGKIGEGGMGMVFAAVHPLIRKRTAIKVLNEDLCMEPGAVQRFVDEARVVNEIGHPNIVDIFAFGKMPNGRYYYVMEWLRGQTLRARVSRSPLGLEETCAVILPLVRALEAAHAKGVVHRDLKPDNVFLVDTGADEPIVKLLDFGVAKLVREEQRGHRTDSGALVGTPRYAAPEQARGLAIDHRVDIYALGAIAFELLAGRPPYTGNTDVDVIAKHMYEPVPRPAAHADVPADIDALVVAMLAKEPDRRPSLAEVAQVIARHPRRLSRPVPAASPRTTQVGAAPMPATPARPAPLPATPPTAITPATVIPATAATPAPAARALHRRWLAFAIGTAVLAAAITTIAIRWTADKVESVATPSAPAAAAPAVEPPAAPPIVEPIVAADAAVEPPPAAAAAPTTPSPVSRKKRRPAAHEGSASAPSSAPTATTPPATGSGSARLGDGLALPGTMPKKEP